LDRLSNKEVLSLNNVLLFYLILINEYLKFHNDKRESNKIILNNLDDLSLILAEDDGKIILLMDEEFALF